MKRRKQLDKFGRRIPDHFGEIRISYNDDLWHGFNMKREMYFGEDEKGYWISTGKVATKIDRKGHRCEGAYMWRMRPDGFNTGSAAPRMTWQIAPEFSETAKKLLAQKDDLAQMLKVKTRRMQDDGKHDNILKGKRTQRERKEKRIADQRKLNGIEQIYAIAQVQDSAIYNVQYGRRRKRLEAREAQNANEHVGMTSVREAFAGAGTLK